MLDQRILLSSSMREGKNLTSLNLFLLQSFQDSLFFFFPRCMFDAELTWVCLFKLTARQLTKSLMTRAIQKYIYK